MFSSLSVVDVSDGDREKEKMRQREREREHPSFLGAIEKVGEHETARNGWVLWVPGVCVCLVCLWDDVYQWIQE